MTLTSKSLSELLGDLQVLLMEVSPKKGERKPVVRSPHHPPQPCTSSSASQVSLYWSVEHTQLLSKKMLIHKTTNPMTSQLFQ